MRNLIYISLAFMVISGCGKNSPCFKSVGNADTKLISDISFTEVLLYDNIDLELKYDTITTIEIESGENLIPFIETKIRKGVLTLKNNNKCNFLRNQKSAVKITISSPELNRLTYYGIGDIWSEDTLFYPKFEFDSYEGVGDLNLILNSDSIEIKEHIGISDVTISGKSNYTYLYLTTLGNFYCKNLLSKKVHVNNSGAGEINLFASDELLIEKRKSGDINYWGNPIITIIANNGSGSINKK